MINRCISIEVCDDLQKKIDEMCLVLGVRKNELADMAVTAYLDKERRDNVEFETHTWSNQACLGYAILASDRLGLTEEQETKLLHAMLAVMDLNTIEKAKQVYLNS